MARPISNLWIFFLGLLGLQLGPVTAQASDAGVLCAGEAPGESTRQGSLGCIDVLSWSWGQSLPIAIGGGGAPIEPGNPSLQDFNFTKFTDSSSDDFFRMLVTGTPLKGVVEYRQYRDCGISCPAPEPYLTIHFRQVWVSSNSLGGSSGDRPVDNVSLAFVDVSYCYRPTIKEGELGAAQCFAFSRATNAQIAPF